MEVITDLTTLSHYCGFFETETGVNNCFGCKHKDSGERDLMQLKNGRYEYVETYNEVGFIAKKMTNLKIKSNRRLAKKFIKKAKKIWLNNDVLKKYGLLQAGKCYSLSCPIAYEVSFDSIKDYENGKDYDYIENEEDMPQGWGDELMAIDKDLSEQLGINSL